MTFVTQCDQCGRTDSGGGWIHVSLGQFAQPGDRGGRALLERDRELDFCTHRCLVTWATPRQGET